MLHFEKSILFGEFICLGFFVFATSAQDCDKSKCKGPLKFYEDLKCKPIYEKKGDCCAISYDCSHLHGRSTDKCHVNGRQYNIGDALKNEDRSSPCDVACICVKGFEDVAMFTCAAVHCPNMPVKEGCYMKRDLDSCCGREFCPKADEKIVMCEFNGTKYKDGQIFYPNDKQMCLCLKDYKGENIEPFCRNIGCGIELRRTMEIHENCTPVFYDTEIPSMSCSYAYRCQNNNDKVIRLTKAKVPEEKSNPIDILDNMKCEFGNMTMMIGDELKQATDYSSVCVKCVCEVPPVPTCQRLPDSQCDVTKHPSFK